MDAFPKMSQNTFFIVKQQVAHIEVFYSLKCNFNNGTKIIDIEPTTDGKMWFGGRFTVLTNFNPFLVMYAPMEFLVILFTFSIS